MSALHPELLSARIENLQLQQHDLIVVDGRCQFEIVNFAVKFTNNLRKNRLIPPFLGGGNGNPLQSSCLEYPMDRGAWWAAVRGVSKSRT